MWRRTDRQTDRRIRSWHIQPSEQQAIPTAVKMDFARRKSAAKFLCVKTVSSRVVGIRWPIYPCTNGWWGISPSTWNFPPKWPTPFKNGDIHRTIWLWGASLPYLRLVYHIHSTPVCHMCQCSTYFLAIMSNSREKLLYSLSCVQSITDAFTNISPQPITK